MSLIWTILIGFIVGVLAKFVTHGPGPSGFFMTAALGIAGSILATFGGRALGWYAAGQSAGFIGAFGALFTMVAFNPPVWVTIVIWLPAILVICLALLRPTKGLLLASQFKNKASESRHG